MSVSTPHRKISSRTGTLIVLANMIGTGVFTSLGFQLQDIQNTGAIISLWLLGGIMALAGAFSYSEVGTVMKQSGGEYVFLSKLYHPIVGYLSGWISLTVGFAAPIALSGIALVNYLPVDLPHPQWISIGIIALVTMIHTRSLRVSATFQSLSTLVKVIIIIALICIGLFLPAPSVNAIGSGNGYLAETGSMAFAVGLIYVSYTYSGWNAAAYITDEFRHPARSLPIALITGTCIVTVLYTLLQYVFLKHVPADQLSGQLNVGTIAVNAMLGDKISWWFDLAISLLLLSGLSAMIWIGPRVTAGMASEHRLWRFFQSKEKCIPVRALWLQFLISSILILSSTFEEILIYCGVLLNITSMLVVLGVFILRRKNRGQELSHYKSPFFPFFQLLFLVVSGWMILFSFISKTTETLMGIGNIGIGLLTWYGSNRWQRREERSIEKYPLQIK
jgi:basic amino acid/polyamine antiporter, APA family